MVTDADNDFLVTISKAIAAIGDQDELFAVIVDALAARFQFDAAVIIAVDVKRGTLQPFVKYAPPEVERLEEFRSFIREPIPIVGSPVEQMLESPGVMTIDYAEMASTYRDFQPLRILSANGIRRGMSAPLYSGGRIIGLLSLASRRENVFTPDDAVRFEGVAQQVGMAFGTMLAYDDLRRRESEKGMLLAVSNALTTIRERNAMTHALATAIDQVVACDFFGIYFGHRRRARCQQAAGMLKMPNGRFVPIARFFDDQDDIAGIEQKLFDPQGTPILATGDRLTTLRNRSSAIAYLIDDHGIEALLGLSIPLADNDRGIMLLAREGRKGFAIREMETLVGLPQQIGLALDNLFAFEEIEQLRRQLEDERTYLVDEIKGEHNFEEIIGSSRALREVFRRIAMVAPTDATVLVQGETGTGKELVARALHNLSPRRERPLVKVNCASLPAQLVESELFGHERGSFTGATERRIGKFELARGGTIFLDEIGEMPPELQAKLLRVLQEREIERVGGAGPVSVDVRVIAVTNRDLEREVADGRFRADLFFRLNVVPISVPPLRERREDIPLLVAHLLSRLSRTMGRAIDGVTDRGMRSLVGYDWPGNVRELAHILERSVILSTGSRIDPESFLAVSRQSPKATLMKTLEEAEREHILSALEISGGRVSGAGGAAELLSLKPTTLSSRMKKLGIRVERNPRINAP